MDSASSSKYTPPARRNAFKAQTSAQEAALRKQAMPAQAMAHNLSGHFPALGELHATKVAPPAPGHLETSVPTTIQKVLPAWHKDGRSLAMRLAETSLAPTTAPVAPEPAKPVTKPSSTPAVQKPLSYSKVATTSAPVKPSNRPTEEAPAKKPGKKRLIAKKDKKVYCFNDLDIRCSRLRCACCEEDAQNQRRSGELYDRNGVFGVTSMEDWT